MSNPLTDVFTSSSPTTPTPPTSTTRSSSKPIIATSLTASFAMDPIPAAWPAVTRSALAAHVHRMRAALESTLTTLSTHPLLTRAATHPALVRLAEKLNMHPHLVAALVAAAAVLAASALVAGKRALAALTALVPITHTVRALEANDNPRHLKSALKLWLLYMLTAPMTSKSKYTRVVARLALLTYKPDQAASIAYALVIRPAVAAAVKHGVIPRQVAVVALGMDPDGGMDVAARSPIDMHDVPVVVQRAVGLVVAARPEVGKYLGVEPGGGDAWVPGSEQGTGVHASPVARGIVVGSDMGGVEEAEGEGDERNVHHVRKTSGGGVLGLASVKLQQQLSGGGTARVGGQMQQFVDAEEDAGQEVAGRGRASGRLAM